MEGFLTFHFVVRFLLVLLGVLGFLKLLEIGLKYGQVYWNENNESE